MPSQNKWVSALVNWYETEKRDLPWRRTADPYAIWISEIMLQQTRVEAVIAYYKRFLHTFPSVHALANAREETVLKAWEGLGYYSRARNLHKAAKLISNMYGGVFPHTFDDLKKLPGIGDYTAGAIASIAFGQAVPAIDGNVKRVTARILGLRENINQPAIIRGLRQTLTDAMPKDKASAFNQALMELGALLCIPRNPRCAACPLSPYCDACAAGDADSLPVMDQKKPPTTITVAVCLFTYQQKILLFKRKERLLHNLYVFGLAEAVSEPDNAQSYWAERGLQSQYMDTVGEARHVFTHRIWEMQLFHFQLLQPPEATFLRTHSALLTDCGQLKALPLPTAMKAAKQAALLLLDSCAYAPK